MKKIKKRKRRTGWIVLAGILILAAVASVVLLATAEEPPLKDIEDTRTILSKAESLNAEVYSRKLYREAKVLYDSAMTVWKKENEKFFICRRYEGVVGLAGKAKNVGLQAVLKAEEVRKNSKDGLKEEIKVLRQEMTEFEKIFAALPLSREAKSEHSKGKLLLNEAEIAFEKGEYSDGREKSRLASVLIRNSYKEARKVLEEYFRQLPEWQEQLKEAVARSDREKSYVIVVEKLPSRCDLYYNGVKKYSFEAEFGRNWIGDKRQEGDYATPEGDYRVVRKLDRGTSKYYKALLIDYPNRDDRANFRKLKKEGVVASNARPGNLIEIHGHGGRGANWTNGCVAVKDSDMDKIFSCAERGTPITIIGASRPLDEVLKSFHPAEQLPDEKKTSGE